MKVLLINGSTKKGGVTYLALKEVAGSLNKEGIETEIIEMGPGPYRDCIGCNSCSGKGRCIFKDDLANAIIEKAESADGFVFASPVYYSHPTGQLLSLMDRLFYAGGHAFKHKVGAAIVTARRAGTTASLAVLNRYFENACMVTAGSTYWNMAFGPNKELLPQDLEGLQTMRNLGKNMAWILKSLEKGKENGVGLPEEETSAWTNFNR